MTTRALLSVILAAGRGTRMKSVLPKVLHAIAGRSLLGHVLALADGLQAGSRLAVVIGPDMDNVRREAGRLAPEASVFVQANQLGTGDAVKAAAGALKPFAAEGGGDVVVLYADTPLLTPATIGRLRTELANGAHVAVLGFEPADPSGYGRLLTGSDGRLLAIREDRDATPAEKAVRLCKDRKSVV